MPPMPRILPTDIAELEAAWAGYYGRWAAWLRDSTQRLPDDALRRQEAELLAARQDIAQRLRLVADPARGSEDDLAVRTVRSAVGDLDGWVPGFDGVDFGHGGNAPLPEEREAAALRRETLNAFVAAASGMPAGTERLHRLTL